MCTYLELCYDNVSVIAFVYREGVLRFGEHRSVVINIFDGEGHFHICLDRDNSLIIISGLANSHRITFSPSVLENQFY